MCSVFWVHYHWQMEIVSRHTHYTLKQSGMYTVTHTCFQRKPLLCSPALPCCSCVHNTLMPKLNKGLSSGDFGRVAELKWAEIKCPWIESWNSQHRDFLHPAAYWFDRFMCFVWVRGGSRRDVLNKVVLSFWSETILKRMHKKQTAFFGLNVNQNDHFRKQKNHVFPLLNNQC